MNILLGIFEVATGRARGVGRFGAMPRDFFVSLYVLMALPAIASLALVASIGVGGVVSVLLLLTCALLAPLVISHALAQFWRKDDQWLRFAVVYNWSQVALIVIFAALLALAAVLRLLGIPRDAVLHWLLFIAIVYVLWLQWFVARHALRISAGRAILATLAIHVGTSILVTIPGIVMTILMGDMPDG